MVVSSSLEKGRSSHHDRVKFFLRPGNLNLRLRFTIDDLSFASFSDGSCHSFKHEDYTLYRVHKRRTHSSSLSLSLSLSHDILI